MDVDKKHGLTDIWIHAGGKVKSADFGFVSEKGVTVRPTHGLLGKVIHKLKPGCDNKMSYQKDPTLYRIQTQD